MAEDPTLEDRLAEWEAIWNLVSRILFAFLGAILLVYAGVFAEGDDVKVRIFLGMAGLALMGPIVAASFATASGRGSAE